MKKKILTALATLTYCITTAQFEVHRIELTSPGALFRNPDYNNLNLKKIEGSPYLDDNFVLAEISGVPEKILIRYNILNDIIEVQFDNLKNYNLTKSDPYLTITPIGKANKIKLLRYIRNEVEIFGYLTQILETKEIEVYKKNQVKLQNAKEPTSSYQETSPAKFIKLKPEYYWKLSNKKITQISKHKKGILELFPDKKEAINIYFKNNRIDFDDESSIIELSKFIQTLQ
ncbi:MULTISPECIES: hypothetical protein [Flavobacterium]|uniref:Uncharacterized protein n=1 Tax=Flavobacterium succinicans TaxID=29536 RepID=A0A199XRL9_9FLAO|nr:MULTISPECIES: hypothetical protein [Flavobacterium]OAZ03969.1 hypothetical protein FLB_16590 [Flavobacterium succinicans]